MTIKEHDRVRVTTDFEDEDGDVIAVRGEVGTVISVHNGSRYGEAFTIEFPSGTLVVLPASVVEKVGSPP